MPDVSIPFGAVLSKELQLSKVKILNPVRPPMVAHQYSTEMEEC
jgi:hypothetical protein